MPDRGTDPEAAMGDKGLGLMLTGNLVLRVTDRAALR